MDLKLSEEESLIQKTAARFVDKELLTREGEYLKQQELFLPPGDPPRRELDPEIRETLKRIARRVGLWLLELSSDADAPRTTTLARVLIQREFGRTILPFEPPVIPALMGKSPYAKPLLDGKLSLSLAFDQIHKTGALHWIETRFREVPDGYSLSNTQIDVLDPDADLYLFPAREEGSERAGLFLLEQSTSGLTVSEREDLTTDATVARMTLSFCKLRQEQLLGYEYDVAALIASEQLRIAARCLGITTRCLAESIEHARNRVTFGRPLASRQAIQWMLANLSISLRTCTWQTLRA